MTQAQIVRTVEVFGRITKMLTALESCADDLSLGKVELLALQLLGRRQELTMSQLAKALGIGLSTATKIVDRLAEKKLVSRKRNHGDRRVVRVVLTSRGQKTVSDYETQFRAAVAKMLGVLNADEQESFIGAWEKIADAAG